ncbi:hypothetical protein Godav_000960, partial [Gossypium davidsonii]|nr:hypothetical protein [Gossypium davidsonii]
NSEHTNDEYICITAHWVDKDWKLQKRIIRFRALFPPYDVLNIADELVLCLSQWRIDKRKFSFTLDNASYNDVMVSYLQNRFRANRIFWKPFLAIIDSCLMSMLKKSKFTYSSVVGSSNVPDNNPVGSSLHQYNVNNVDFGGDYDESDYYKRQLDVLDYWSKSSVRYNEFSLLARDLLAISISTVASKLTFSMGKKVITPLRSSLKPKTIQAAICFDD